ncbi:hypothetical protein [Acidipropionibacterium thoenii]|uniref:hypothetical protein n=1 Tax=Acidipropionibacterium thoenii TaxID=1751 RepID=UPI000563D731|nr:hypothetical protein [Acidipropionibacterium thoenii]
MSSGGTGRSGRVAAAAVVLVATGALAGCGAPGSPVSSGSSTAASSAPVPAGSSAAADAVTLRALGIANGPDGFPVPEGLIVSEQVDNPNNVTLVIDSFQGESTYQFLRRRLPAAGYTIGDDANQSLVFSGKGWQGAFTVSQEVAALTLRRP